MLNVTKELTALARKLGYTGKAPDTVAKAINAITSVAGSSSGGGCNCKTMVVHADVEIENQTMTITDATSGEIWEALENGYAVLLTLPVIEVIGKLTASQYSGLGTLASGSYDSGNFIFDFVFNIPTSGANPGEALENQVEVRNLEFHGSLNEYPSTRTPK